MFKAKWVKRVHSHRCWKDNSVIKWVYHDQDQGIPKSLTTLALLSTIHHWTMMTDGTGAVVSVVVFDYRRVFDLIDHHYNPQTRHSSWSLVLGFRHSIQLETACEAGVSLPFWEGPSTCWYFPTDQTWTMALPSDDQRSQHPRHVNVEIRQRYHQCGNYALWWGEPCPKCWQMLILRRSLRKQAKKCFFFSYLTP